MDENTRRYFRDGQGLGGVSRSDGKNAQHNEPHHDQTAAARLEPVHTHLRPTLNQ